MIDNQPMTEHDIEMARRCWSAGLRLKGLGSALQFIAETMTEPVIREKMDPTLIALGIRAISGLNDYIEREAQKLDDVVEEWRKPLPAGGKTPDSSGD